MPKVGAEFDLAIVGGGINGAGIARDAAGRGLRVVLLEQNDLASGTSSASTKLVHGGLRYLEQGWFRLVREALAERETMLRMAPHLVRPMRFLLPITPGMRPPMLLVQPPGLNDPNDVGQSGTARPAPLLVTFPPAMISRNVTATTIFAKMQRPLQ